MRHRLQKFISHFYSDGICGNRFLEADERCTTNTALRGPYRDNPIQLVVCPKLHSLGQRDPQRPKAIKFSDRLIMWREDLRFRAFKIDASENSDG